MDDVAQTITLTDALGLNSVEVSVATGTVTVKGAVARRLECPADPGR